MEFVFYLKVKSDSFIKDDTNYSNNFGSLKWGRPHDPFHLALGTWIKHKLPEFTFSRLSLTSQPASFYFASPDPPVVFHQMEADNKKSIKKLRKKLAKYLEVSFLFKTFVARWTYLLLNILHPINHMRSEYKYNCVAPDQI